MYTHPPTHPHIHAHPHTRSYDESNNNEANGCVGSYCIPKQDTRQVTFINNFEVITFITFLIIIDQQNKCPNIASFPALERKLSRRGENEATTLAPKMIMRQGNSFSAALQRGRVWRTFGTDGDPG